MLILWVLGCVDVCEGEQPTPLFWSPLWNGPEGTGIAWLATFEGPGSICELRCDAEWATPAIVRDDGACVDESPLELEEGELAGLCVVIDEGVVDHTYCTAELGGGPVEIAIRIHPEL